MKHLTNHELARILLSQPELPVVMTYTDHTDWFYVTPITQKFINIDTVFDSELTEDDIDTNEEVRVSMITFSEQWDTENEGD